MRMLWTFFNNFQSFQFHLIISPSPWIWMEKDLFVVTWSKWTDLVQNIFPNILIYNDSLKLVESLCNVLNIFQTCRRSLEKTIAIFQSPMKSYLDSEGRRLLMVGLSWLLPSVSRVVATLSTVFITHLWWLSIAIFFETLLFRCCFLSY